MRKAGPCYHCGIQSTPLWRNGPIEKPVLCNACGSRYRQGKPLENYVPKHGFYNFESRKEFPEAIISKSRKQNDTNSTGFYHGYKSCSNGDSSNSESALSSQESKICSQVEPDDQEHTNGDLGLKQAGSWAHNIPSKKRSICVMYTAFEHIKQLRRDLYSILIKQGSSVSPDQFSIDNADHSRHHEMCSGAKLLPPERQQKTQKCS